MIAILVVGYGPKGFETVELTSNVLERLLLYSPPALLAGTGAESGVGVVFLLGVMTD